MNFRSLPLLTAVIICGCAAHPGQNRNAESEMGQADGLAIVAGALSGKSLENLESFGYQIHRVIPTEDKVVETRVFDSARQHARWATTAERKTDWTVSIKTPEQPPLSETHGSEKAWERVLALRLPEGEYEFYSWVLRKRDEHGTAEYRPARQFSYRFAVKAGHTAYVGRLVTSYGDDAQAHLSIEDHHDEDVAAAQATSPKMAFGNIALEVGRIDR